MLLILLKSLTSRPAKQHDLWQIPAIYPTVYMTQRHPSASRRGVTFSAPAPPQLAVTSSAWHMTPTNNHAPRVSIALLDIFCDHRWRHFVNCAPRDCGMVLIPALLRKELHSEKSFFLETMRTSGERAVKPAVGDGDCNWHYASLAT